MKPITKECICLDCGRDKCHPQCKACEPVQGESDWSKSKEYYQAIKEVDEFGEGEMTKFIRNLLKADRTHLIQGVEKLPDYPIKGARDLIQRDVILEILKK